MNESKTKVIFRRFKNGDVIALFPALAGDMNPNTCSSCMHVGQHGSATASLQDTYATNDYLPLKQELESIGYKLTIVTRFTARDLAERHSQLKA